MKIQTNFYSAKFLPFAQDPSNQDVISGSPPAGLPPWQLASEALSGKQRNVMLHRKPMDAPIHQELGLFTCPVIRQGLQALHIPCAPGCAHCTLHWGYLHTPSHVNPAHSQSDPMHKCQTPLFLLSTRPFPVFHALFSLSLSFVY